MKTHPLFPSRYQLFAVSLLAIFSLPASASALVMRQDSGPEPVIVQIRESLRLSPDLYSSLSSLEQLEQEAGVGVVKSWAGTKLLQLVSFPKDFSEEQALDVIATLRHSSAVEKVVPVSAFNLEFKPGDFVQAYTSTQDIPEANLRGLSTDQVASCPIITQCNPSTALDAPHVANQIIVGWKPQYAWQAEQTGFRQNVTQFHNSAGGHVVQELTPTPTDLIQMIEFDDPETSLAEKLEDYSKSPWVDYVQPNYTYSHYAVAPNDPYYTDPGQPYLAKIMAPQAWAIERGQHNVIVAVADSGANLAHPDFSLRHSPGWKNFYNTEPENDVRDRFPPWHGSHVASIIGAHAHNKQFMAGVAWDVQLLILRVDTSSINGVRVIDYAYSSNQGHEPAIAINCSWGLGPHNCLDRALTDAIRRARQNNMLIVAAAGNGDGVHGINIDAPNNLITPASVPTDNVISVGATRVRPDLPLRDDTKTEFSNYGKYRVELGAPGGEDEEQVGDGYTYGIIGLTQNSVSTPGPTPCDPNSTTRPCTKSSGTSFSAPQVAGAVALVKSKYSWENYAGLRDRVIMGVDVLDALHPDSSNGGFRTGGRLNLLKALMPRTMLKNLSTRARVEGGEKVMIAGFVIGGSAASFNGQLVVGIRGLGPSLPINGRKLVDPVIELHKPGGARELNDNWHDDPYWQDTVTYGLQPGDSSEAAMVRTLGPGAYTVVVRSHGSTEDYGVGLVELYAIGNDEQTRFLNISTRCLVGTGDDVAIAGTILGNPAQTMPPQADSNFPRRRILTFGRGPSLQRFGVTDTLPDPYLEFHQVQNGVDVTIASNDQWKEIDGGLTALEERLVEDKHMPCWSAPDQYLAESALWPSLTLGPYTAILRDAGNASGIGLIEFYEK